MNVTLSVLLHGVRGRNLRKKNKDKTNTESAASSSSNHSSVMGNAGLGVCARLEKCPTFASWKCWHLGGFYCFIQRYLRGAVFRIPYLVSEVNRQCVMKRGDLLRSHLCFVSLCHLKMAVVLVDAFFFFQKYFSLLLCSSLFTFLAP